MARAPSLFSSLARSTEHRLSHLPVPPAWHTLPALAPFATVADALGATSTALPPAGRRPVLAALLRLAPTDRLAAEVLLCALVPALRSVASELSRWATVDADEVDALVAAGTWEAICTLGGSAQPWPDRAVVCRARDFARSRLEAECRRRSREARRLTVPDLNAQEDDGLSTVVARDVLERAVARGRLGPVPARLVWAARVEGRTPAELAALAGTNAEAASMARLRAERVLRREVA
jgi:hypothetical protein